MLTMEMAKKLDICKKMADLKLQQPKHSFMSILLLTEKHKENSFFAPFLASLP